MIGPPEDTNRYSQDPPLGGTQSRPGPPSFAFTASGTRLDFAASQHMLIHPVEGPAPIEGGVKALFA